MFKIAESKSFESFINNFMLILGFLFSCLMFYFDLNYHHKIPTISIEILTMLTYGVLFYILHKHPQYIVQIEITQTIYLVFVSIAIFFWGGGLSIGNMLTFILALSATILLNRNKVLRFFSFFNPLLIISFVIIECMVPSLRQIDNRLPYKYLVIYDLEFLVTSCSIFSLIAYVKYAYDFNRNSLEENTKILYQTNEELQTLTEELRAQSEEVTAQNEQIILQNNMLKEIMEELQSKQIILEELNLKLEEKVLKRTASLKHKNEKLASYAFFNAHILRAPVCRIQGLVSLIKTDYKNKENLSLYIGYLNESVEELELITNKTSKLLDSEENISQDELNKLFIEIFDGKKTVF
ncbi:MAG: hypothetical protein U0V72_12030 [Cytophagales bacterium]